MGPRGLFQKVLEYFDSGLKVWSFLEGSRDMWKVLEGVTLEASRRCTCVYWRLHLCVLEVSHMKPTILEGSALFANPI